MFRSTPGQIQLSTEMRGAIEEDEVLVACEVEVEVGDVLEDELVLVTGVLELELEEEDKDEETLDTTLVLELDELEEDVVVVLVDFGRVAMYPAAIITTSMTTTITTV